MFSIQPFNRCLLRTTLGYNNNDDNEFHTVEEFHILNVSDVDQVKTKLISKYNLDQVGKNDDHSPMPPIRIIEKIILDWETDLMNQLENQQKPIRASGIPHIRKDYYACTVTERVCFMWRKGVNEFNLNDMKIYTPTVNVHDIYEGVGFVDGFMLMLARYSGINLEKSSTVDSLEFEPCPEVNFTKGETSAIVIPSGSNILKKGYSLTGLLSGKLIYLFDLNQKKFVESFDMVPYDNTIETIDMTFTGKELFIPYLEDNRLRSFLLQNQRLFELVWKGEEFKSDVVMIRHLEWIEKIHSVCRIDNYGLLLKCSTKNRFVYKIYKPQPFNSNHSKNGGIFIELPTSVKQLDLHYSPKSKCLIYLDENSLNISIFKTLEEINLLPCHKVEEIFNHEEYLEKLTFDASFKNYQPRLITDSCEIITNIPNNARITQAYQIKVGCFNQIEIVAGINCKNISSLKEIIADDYIELKPEDFADYLGAPIIYPYYGRVGYTAFLMDMQNLKRSSKSLEIVTAFNGKIETLFQMCLDQIEERIYVGILSCKPKSDDMNDEDSIQEEKEYEIMFKRNEFKVESKKLVVADVFSDIYPRRNRPGVIINNVRSGIWKWITTNKSQDNVNSEENDDNSISQLVVIHQDYFNDLSNSKLWMVPDNVYRTPSNQGFVEMDEYYDDEIEGGWYVMKNGVTVYTQATGIFDRKYFNDEKCLGQIKKKTPLEKSITSVPEYSEWQDYLSEKMQQYENCSTFAVPYGIITNCNEESGLCLFKKSKSGDVIAVRVIYC